MRRPQGEPRRGGRGWDVRLRAPFNPGACGVAFTVLLAPSARAGIVLPAIMGDSAGDQDVTWLALLILLLFGTFTAVLHLLGRREWTRREKALTSELAQTHARLDRANLFLSTEPQIVVAWNS